MVVLDLPGLIGDGAVSRSSCLALQGIEEMLCLILIRVAFARISG